MLIHRALIFALFGLFLSSRCSAAIFMQDIDLLIVGGNEAAVAAAVQAARMGVKDIVLVNDIEWLGGQFSSEAVGAVDEWTIVNGKRTNFPRSGMFLEIINRIQAHNLSKYGKATPGNAVTATDTIEPAAAAAIFTDFLKTYGVQVESNALPDGIVQDGDRTVVVFRRTKSDGRQLDQIVVRARQVIDCSDWGDVVKLSGAEYFAGPDPRSRFDEPSAPEEVTDRNRNEMNPISYCLVLRERDDLATMDKPPHYDERRYYCAVNTTRAQFDALGFPKGVLALNTPPFVDSAYPEGIYSRNQSVYTQRRLLDQHHNNLAAGSERILINWVAQDYPLYDYPRWVVDALEATERGASRKNIVDMTYKQRQIVFDDAKWHALGLLCFLQNLPDQAMAEKFQKLKRVDDFGTIDKLPPKPYVREGLRLHALSMLREQDIRTPHAEPKWAKVMPHDGLFGFQFNIDFHPTRRQFLNDDNSGPWGLIHTPTRNWSTHTDRAMLSARSLVPVKVDHLIGCSKNIGLTSITSSALRLHGQMMLTGQAAGALAAVCLEKKLEPREVVKDGRLIESLQRTLVQGSKEQPGVLLWPYHDLPPDAPHFVAANLLAVWGILPGRPETIFFEPEQTVSRCEAIGALNRAVASLARPELNREVIAASYPGVKFDEPATCEELRKWIQGESLPVDNQPTVGPLSRAKLATMLFHAIKDQPRWHAPDEKYLVVGHDADGDGVADLDDPLPFDKDNDNVPDRIDETP